jgi:molybdopterin converting factor small subunit
MPGKERTTNHALHYLILLNLKKCFKKGGALIMKVKIKLFATLRKYIKEKDRGTCILELPESIKVQEVLDMLNIPGDIPKIILINGLQKGLDDTLKDEDTLSVFPPIAGG